MHSDPVVEGALAMIATAFDELDTTDLSHASVACRLEFMDRIEMFRRLGLSKSHTVAASLADEDIGVLSDRLATLIANVLRIHPQAAARRLAEADLLRPRQTLTGQPLTPHLPTTAHSWAAGQIDDEHLKVIRNFFDKQIPTHLPVDVIESCEEFLARKALEVRPDQLSKLAAQLAITVNPDGMFTDEDRKRNRTATLGPQGPDGMSKLTLWITAEFRAYLEAWFAKYAQRGACLPDDDDPFGAEAESPSEPEPEAESPAEPEPEAHPQPEPEAESPAEPTPEPEAHPPAESESARSDHRTPGQRRHDAMEAALKALLGNPLLGRHKGRPLTVVATTTLDQLTRAAGHAVTATGTLIPIPDLIQMAADGCYPFLAVFDNHKSRALHLGEARRCATGDQFLMLFARERGCSRPNCPQPADRCEVHHTTPWAAHRRTDIDDLSLACFGDHPLVGPTGWDTTVGRDGKVAWTPPPHYPRNTPATNDFHHPERYLSEFEKDGDDIEDAG